MKKKIPFVFVLAIAALLASACSSNPASSSPVSAVVSSLASSSATTTSAYLSSQPVSSRLRKATGICYVAVENGVENQNIDLYFVDGYDDVPFLKLADSLDLVQRVSNDMTLTAAGELVTLGRSENAGTVVFDFEKHTFHSDNLDLFAARHSREADLNLVSNFGETDDGKTKYLQSQAAKNLDYFRKGKAVDFDLAQRNIPMYFEDGNGYIPLQTLSDLVFSQFNVFVLFNGTNLYMSGATLPTEMVTSFYQAPTGTRSEALARFTRDEFAMAMDFQYGLKEEHGISDFDTYFKESGLDEKMLSSDPVLAGKGLYQLINDDLADHHSSYLMASPYAGADGLTSIADPSLVTPVTFEFNMVRATYTAARTAVYKATTSGAKTAPDVYEEYGDVAYVTLDSFTNPSTDADYYKTAPDATAADTFGIIGYAHSRIFAKDSPVKKVVLDLSCNPGGALNAGMYVAGWFLPASILNIKNTLTGALGSFTYFSDVNYDGVYNASDRLSSLQLYCLVSPASFSCSNFEASLFRDSKQVRLIGGKTSGGSCVVQYLSLADGTLCQTSGNKELCTQKNGSYYSIDTGIDVDYPLASLQDFYTRSALSEKIDALY